MPFIMLSVGRRDPGSAITASQAAKIVVVTKRKYTLALHDAGEGVALALSHCYSMNGQAPWRTQEM